MHRIRVLVADDHPIFRQGILSSLENVHDIAVAGEAVDGYQTIQKADKLGPDVVLLDINMPGMTGIDVARTLKQRHPQIGIVILTMHEDDEQLFKAVEAGVAAYYTKDIDARCLTNLVRRVQRGEFPIAERLFSEPFITSPILDDVRRRARLNTKATVTRLPLTHREMEIVCCIAGGYTNKEIAHILGISAQTVKNHITSILDKLDVTARTQAVLYAMRHGWIRLEVGTSDGFGTPELQTIASSVPDVESLIMDGLNNG